MKKLLRNLSSLIGVVLFGVALFVIHHKLRQYHYHDIVDEMARTPSLSLVLAVLLTILNYFVLTGYDALALRYIKHPLGYPQLALASFIGYVFSHNATIAGGSAARYRIYSVLGVSASEAARLIVFCSITFWLGFFAIAGVFFLFQQQQIPTSLHLPFNSVRPLGIIFIIIVLFYIVFAAVRKRPLKVHEWEFAPPTLGLSVGQIAIASFDWLVACGILYVLLPKMLGLTFIKFVGIYLLAAIVGLMSTVPGGLGVFETVILLLLSGFGEPAPIVGALLLYRVIYYFMPLVVASILLGVHELLHRKDVIKRVSLAFGLWNSIVVPYIFAFTSFVAGAILIFSGALPAGKGHMAILRGLLPLPVVEISHFLGSIAGIGLLILAHGLQRRLDAAYHLTVGLLIAGITLSLLKGLGYHEAIILGVMLLVLIPCRNRFYRKASLLSERFTLPWAASIVAVLVCSVWLGLFSYKHLDYSNQLWWRFAIEADAPRFLRASAGAAIFVLFLAFARIFVPAKHTAIPSPDKTDLDKAEPVVRSCPKTYAWLALLGDKKFLYNDAGNAFIMYAVQGRSWIAMGDPIGPEDQWRDLIWDFEELCDQYDGWPVFFQVEKTHLDLYLELGMTFLKLGEEARVNLQQFSLEGTSRRRLRHSHNKVEKQSCIFSIIEQQNVAGVLDEVKKVSDKWLEDKHTREKRFSLGFFNPQYLSKMPLAVVTQDDKIIAFANILLGAQKQELSVDLMRFLPSCPEGTMDYLFAELMLWGRQQGYRWFNFGMAPLSGIENRALAPLWSHAEAFIFKHGEHFYNFQGLRQYKDKFGPQWAPTYLACHKGLMLPRLFANLTALISGGITGVVTK